MLSENGNAPKLWRSKQKIVGIYLPRPLTGLCQQWVNVLAKPGGHFGTATL
jgi:hypothetical protein